MYHFFGRHSVDICRTCGRRGNKYIQRRGTRTGKAVEIRLTAGRGEHQGWRDNSPLCQGLLWASGTWFTLACPEGRVSLWREGHGHSAIHEAALENAMACSVLMPLQRRDSFPGGLESSLAKKSPSTIPGAWLEGLLCGVGHSS